MTKAAFTRRGGVLVAADNEARELLDAIKEGKDVMVEIRPARNVRHHRMLFGLLKLLVENTDVFAGVEDALVALKIAIREVDTHIDAATGQVFYIPRSIAFESCDQARFTRIFNRSLYVICDRWLVGTDMEALREEVFALVDGPAAIGRRAA